MKYHACNRTVRSNWKLCSRQFGTRKQLELDPQHNLPHQAPPKEGKVHRITARRYTVEMGTVHRRGVAARGWVTPWALELKVLSENLAAELELIVAPSAFRQGNKRVKVCERRHHRLSSGELLPLSGD